VATQQKNQSMSVKTVDAKDIHHANVLREAERNDKQRRNMKYFHRRLRKAYKDSELTLDEASSHIGGISLPYFQKVLRGQYIKNKKRREMVEEWILTQESK